MKKQSITKLISSAGVLSILVLLTSTSCQQRSGADIQGELSEIREEKIEIMYQIDEALAMADFDDFKSHTENALNNLDNQIENYHDEMDRADRRIDKQNRDAIIAMKQKKAAIEYKLEILDNRDNNNMDNQADRYPTIGGGAERQGDTTGSMEFQGGERTNEVPRTDRIDDRAGQRSGADRTVDLTGSPEQTDGMMGTGQYNQAGGDFNQLVEEIKNDLRELRRNIEQFVAEQL